MKLENYCLCRGFAIAIAENTGAHTVEQWAREFTPCRPDTIRSGTVAGRTAVFCTGEANEGQLDAGAMFENAGKMFYLSSTITSSEIDLVLGSLRL